MSRGVITLTTDWNGNFNFMGVVKGYWLDNSISVPIVEITHQIPVFNVNYACYVVMSVYRSFPTDSVHVIGVNNFWRSDFKSKILLARYAGHWFIGYENESFFNIFENDQEELFLWELPYRDTVFPEFELMIKPAVELFSGKSVDAIGNAISNAVIFKSRPTFVDDIMTASILFIDVYGNVVTNCTRDQFYEFVQNRPFEIMILRPKNKITKISEGYNQEIGTLFAVFNSLGYLELGIVNYRLDLSVGVRPDSKIKITRL